MPIEHHPLIQEFPEYAETIHRLESEDPDFKQLCDEYHRLDDEIFDHNEDIEPCSDSYAESLKFKRVHLKDTLFQLLEQAEH